jgi:uncharacterized protein (DUF885 family)
MTDFDGLVHELLTDEFDRSPVLASSLGLTDYDERLDDLSAEAMLARDVAAESWIGRFGALDGATLDADQQIDRDLAIATMRGRTILAGWAAWKRDPLTYSSPPLQGIFSLFLHRLRPEADLVDAAVSRLEALPGALEQGKQNLDPALAHPLIVGRGAAAARGGVRYLRELLPQDVQDPAARQRLAEAGDRAAQAVEGWVEHLERLAEQAHGEWQLGEERYTQLLRERESLGYDARSLRERGQQEYDQLDREMRSIAGEIRGHEDWRAILEDANEHDHPPTEEAMRVAYEDWTERARTFLSDTGLVTLPAGEHCTVEPSPVFQRPVIGVASYNGPPAFSDSVEGHFFVPFAPDGAPPEEIQKRLAANSHGGIPTTAVHEAYPGHHWHITMRKLHAPRIRRVFGTPYFNEGWALYSEQVMREQGFFTDPLQELYHLEATIFRAARIVVDTSLHLGDMSYDEAVTYMTTKVPLPEPTARAEVGRYCWWPTQASAYLTGCLEILRIRDGYLAARGHHGAAREAPVPLLRDFHDTMASSGSLPLGLAERAIMARTPVAS